ncbi:MAG: IcmT/TraK family protein [Deltaproteobacteria bacterium]|jgi:intracellular multiplication protein IcmT|nr:IcmT/TraK family protein [Deltaproteobacteria bacterium]
MRGEDMTTSSMEGSLSPTRSLVPGLTGRTVVPWAFTALQPRLGRLDARAVFPILLWLLHWSWWTFGLALAGVAFLAWLDWSGLPFEAVPGRARTLLVGRLRPALDVAVLRARADW